MALKKINHPNGRSFHWRCDQPNCGYVSSEEDITRDNFNVKPGPCLKCLEAGRQLLESRP